MTVKPLRVVDNGKLEAYLSQGLEAIEYQIQIEFGEQIRLRKCELMHNLGQISDEAWERTKG